MIACYDDLEDFCFHILTTLLEAQNACIGRLRTAERMLTILLNSIFLSYYYREVAQWQSLGGDLSLGGGYLSIPSEPPASPSPLPTSPVVFLFHFRFHIESNCQLWTDLEVPFQRQFYLHPAAILAFQKQSGCFLALGPRQ